MRNTTRRQFLADVGQGMLLASVGAALATDLGLAADLGLATAYAGEVPADLTFGALEPLVALMQETSADKLLPLVVEKLNAGTELRTIVAAAALANARTFGGQDYVGYHSFMALAPAFAMSQELPEAKRALPVLKVLYRNTNRMQAFGGRAKEVLHPVEAAELHDDDQTFVRNGNVLQRATRSANMDAAERTFAALAKGPAGEAFNHLQFAVQDEVDVHRVVLSWRAWATLDLTGQEHAQTLLRQSVRYCVETEQRAKKDARPASPIRGLLPKLLDQYKLLGRDLGDRDAEDGWIADTSRLISSSSPEKAADAVAAALAEGLSPEDVGEAISLAANELVLRDPGREEAASPEKPAGSVHGDSVGVHASDSANAWRNIARVSNHRNTLASLIVGAYHTAGRYGRLNKEFYPLAEHLEKVTATEPEALLAELSSAIRGQDQFRACAVVEKYGQKYGQLATAARPVFDLLLQFATSEDGALHAEKYYRTVAEEFAKTRATFRWRQLVALARVTASEYGRPAPGYAQACALLKV